MMLNDEGVAAVLVVVSGVADGVAVVTGAEAVELVVAPDEV